MHNPCCCLAAGDPSDHYGTSGSYGILEGICNCPDLPTAQIDVVVEGLAAPNCPHLNAEYRLTVLGWPPTDSEGFAINAACGVVAPFDADHRHIWLLEDDFGPCNGGNINRAALMLCCGNTGQKSWSFRLYEAGETWVAASFDLVEAVHLGWPWGANCFNRVLVGHPFFFPGATASLFPVE